MAPHRVVAAPDVTFEAAACKPLPDGWHVPQRVMMAPACSSAHSSRTPAASAHTFRYGPVQVRPAGGWPPMVRHDAWCNRAVPAVRLRPMLITYPFGCVASQPR